VPTTISARVNPVTSEPLTINTSMKVKQSKTLQSDEDSESSDLNEEDKEFLENALKKGMPNKK